MAGAPMDVDEGVKDIFDGVYFAIVPNDCLPEDETSKARQDLESHGAIHCPLYSSELRNVTHLISTTSDFPAYHDAVEGFIHVVRPSWVSHSIEKKRAANPRQYSPDPKLFLNDVVINLANDIPQGDKDAIIGGVQAMGGQYSATMTKLVTHVVALTMGNPQCEIIADRKLKSLPVLPHWFDACLRLGKKIDAAPYVLPNPPILSNNANSKPIRQSAMPDLDGASQLTPTPLLQSTFLPSSSPSKERRELVVFRNRLVMLHEDLKLSHHIHQSLTDLIANSGGRVVDSIEDASILVCQSRSSSEYRFASQAGYDVGNLNWLYYLINKNTWTSPTRRLLHYPYPQGGVPGFQKLKISVSNYQGEARIYLESLVHAAGGKYTKTMTSENTHLITAHTRSEKCTAAKEWNVKMINHLWLEETYARCAIQSETDPRYTTFPSRTNLGEVVGQTQIDRESVESLFFPLPPPRKTNQSPEAPPFGTSPSGHQLEPLELNTLPQKTPFKSSPLKNNENNKYKSKDHGFKTPASRSTLNPKASINGVNSDTPDRDATPGSRGRACKDRALNKLHSMAPDIALFEKESKRVGGVIYGGRRAGDSDRVGNDTPKNANVLAGRKRKSSPLAESSPTTDKGPSADVEDIEQRPTKKTARKSLKDETSNRQSSSSVNPASPVKTTTKAAHSSVAPLKVLVTGLDPSKHPTLLEITTALSKKNGPNLRFTQDPLDSSIDFLCTTRILRTVKFISTIAQAPHIVSIDWLLAMLDKSRNPEGKRLDWQPYILHDDKTEEENDFSLQESIERAKTFKSKGGLFKDWKIFVTENVRGGFDGAQSIIVANGGEAYFWKGRENKATTNILKNESENSETDTVFLVTDAKDRSSWSKFRECTVKQGLQCKIVMSDWLLRVATIQDLDCWNEQWECHL